MWNLDPAIAAVRLTGRGSQHNGACPFCLPTVGLPAAPPSAELTQNWLAKLQGGLQRHELKSQSSPAPGPLRLRSPFYKTSFIPHTPPANKSTQFHLSNTPLHCQHSGLSQVSPGSLQWPPPSFPLLPQESVLYAEAKMTVSVNKSCHNNYTFQPSECCNLRMLRPFVLADNPHIACIF
jgi:hypothetical protein